MATVTVSVRINSASEATAESFAAAMEAGLSTAGLSGSIRTEVVQSGPNFEKVKTTSTKQVRNDSSDEDYDPED